METPQITRLGRAEEKREERRRESRIKRLLILLLLLLLLLFGLLLAYLALYGDFFERFNRTPVKFLFSVFGFDRPLAVSTNRDGNIFVSDTGNARFLIFNAQGKFVRIFYSTKKPDRFYGVIGSYYDDKEKKFYIADFRMRVINVYNPAGKRLARWPKDPLDARSFGSLGFSPFAVVAHKGKLYITSNDGIYVFSKAGKLLKKWSKRGKEIGQWDYPVGLAIDADGTMFVADQLNRRVVAMNQRGVVKWVLGRSDQQGKSSSFFGLPRGIALDKEGRLFVSDTFHHEIVVLTRTGKLIGVVGSRGVEDGKLDFPESIAFRPDGVLYVTDRENNRIQAWRVNQAREPGKDMLKRYKLHFRQSKG